jgi:hypothetical protein
MDKFYNIYSVLVKAHRQLTDLTPYQTSKHTVLHLTTTEGLKNSVSPNVRNFADHKWLYEERSLHPGIQMWAVQ